MAYLDIISIVYQATSQKHLGVVLEEHLRLIFSKINRTIDLLRKLQCLNPRSALLTIYKTFVGPHFDHSDITDEKANSPFPQKFFFPSAVIEWSSLENSKFEISEALVLSKAIS